jgi:hypothetical protein
VGRTLGAALTHLYISTRLHGGASNETAIFIVIACRPSNHTNPEQSSPNIIQQSSLSKAEVRPTAKKRKWRTGMAVLICSFIQSNIDQYPPKLTPYMAYKEKTMPCVAFIVILIC